MTETDRTNLAALFTLAWYQHVVRVADEPWLWSVERCLPTFEIVLRRIGGDETAHITVPPTRLRRVTQISDAELDALDQQQQAKDRPS